MNLSNQTTFSLDQVEEYINKAIWSGAFLGAVGQTYQFSLQGRLSREQEKEQVDTLCREMKDKLDYEYIRATVIPSLPDYMKSWVRCGLGLGDYN